MSKLEAERKLQRHGKNGNWRFKGLLLAHLPGSDVSREDMARAWPTPGQKGDYRFLAANDEHDAETAMTETVVAERGEDAYRALSLARDADTPKHLSASSIEQDESTRALGGRLDDVIKRTLFAGSTPEEVDTLFRDQLLETVMAGAERRKVARDAANVINADTPRGDVPVASDEQFAPSLAQGAEIRDDRELYDTVSFDTTKHGQGARITDELVDTAMVDVIERQIEFVGAAVENAINRSWLNEIVDSAGNNFTANSGERGVPALNGAYGEVDAEDFTPDVYVTHPEFRTTLFDDSNIAFANRAGGDDVIRERVFDPLLSVEHYGSSDATYDGSGSWGYAQNGEVGAVTYDSTHVHVVNYSPGGSDIEIKEYEDPIRDLQGVNARIHTDTILTQERAVATVTDETV
jgi:hypothetical protein